MDQPAPHSPLSQASALPCGSIEVLPRTAAAIADFRSLLAPGTRIYIAHVHGTPVDDMVKTATRLRGEGFAVMPHIPARSIGGPEDLQLLLTRYRQEADVREALLLGGGATSPAGRFTSCRDMLETGLFEALGFERLHVAGHPEGNRDIDPDGSTGEADRALFWKQDYARRTGIAMAIITQFAFEPTCFITWSERIAALGITLPVHVGLAGPTKLQTLIKYAIACGVGPSLKVLQKRALDVRRLLTPFEPTELAGALTAYKQANPESLISAVHLFPLGGIDPAARWMSAHPTA
ncbi:methylenetetrahydrofolate reductase [Rhizobium paknamense]|uniref:Methylenetetrahydrofolate reductase (NADPH) n=1 Tax=Rhizobium paknamense TaxID=1206817 RepID=A0ABU0I9K6_9HYPH|nr:methylenetetrahydrofolate reductase [Rhizobium paknamense]MDQ0454920.1 methylenetetrahydrofolate reductase (NADPH) [Rhizobium paknamense]